MLVFFVSVSCDPVVKGLGSHDTTTENQSGTGTDNPLRFFG